MDSGIDQNNSLDTVTPIQLSIPVADNIKDYNDKDCFKFTTTKNGNVDIVFNHSKLVGVETKFCKDKQ